MSRWEGVRLVPIYKRILVVLLVSGCCINTYFLWRQWRSLAEGYADFTIFYSAADIVHSGQAKQLYSEQAQYLAQRAVAPNVRIRNMALPYNHPPFEALVFLPLRRLPYLPAYLAWAAINVAFLFIAVRLLHPGASSSAATTGLFVAALIFFPVFITLFQGQDLILLLLIVSAAYAFIKRGYDFRAGITLGLGLFRPELALPMTLLISVNRGKRFAAGFFIAAAGLTVISVAVVGWQCLLAYPGYVWHMERVHGHGSIVPAVMPNFRGIVALLCRNKKVGLLTTTLISVIVFAISLQQIRSAKISRSTERVFCAAVLCALLVSFHALIHDLALLVIPIMFICAEWVNPQQPLSLRECRILFWPVLFFFCTPMLLFLWLGVEMFSLVTLVLSVWLWGILVILKPIAATPQILAFERT